MTPAAPCVLSFVGAGHLHPYPILTAVHVIVTSMINTGSGSLQMPNVGVKVAGQPSTVRFSSQGKRPTAK